MNLNILALNAFYFNYISIFLKYNTCFGQGVQSGSMEGCASNVSRVGVQYLPRPGRWQHTLSDNDAHNARTYRVGQKTGATSFCGL